MISKVCDVIEWESQLYNIPLDTMLVKIVFVRQAVDQYYWQLGITKHIGW